MIWMQVGVLLLIASAVLPLAVPGNRQRVAANLVAQSLACGFLLSQTVPILLGGPPLAGAIEWSYPVERIDLRIDPLAAFFLTFSLPLTLLGSVYAVGYLAADIRSERHAGTHFALLGVVQLSYVVVYTVQNAFAFMVGWEMAALSAWLLVIWNHRDQKVRFAGFNYLVSTHLSLLCLVASVTLMHGEAHSFQFRDFEGFLARPGTTRGVVFVLLVAAFGLKSAFFPGHSWLPRAHSAAPAHVSALMSGVIHKAGLFGLLKFVLMIGRPEEWMGWTVLAFSAASAFMGVLYTIAQRDIKRLLGYSSTENVGIAGMGFGLGCLGLAYDRPALVALGFGGGILHVLNHALFKCLLFYGAGAVYRFTHTVDMEKLGGLLPRMRWTAPLFLVGSLASAALPPLNGFVGEFLLYLGFATPDPALGAARIPLLAAVALLALVGGLSALSVVRSFGVVFLGVPRDPSHVHPGAHEHPLMILPMVVHSLGVMAIGLVPWLGLAAVAEPTSLFLRLSAAPDNPLVGHVPAATLESITLLAAVLVGLVVALLAARLLLLPRADRRHVTWGCGYTRPNPRMQYTGAGFSQPMADVFRDLLRFLRREELPRGLFPVSGRVETYCADAVEYGIFHSLAVGEGWVASALARIPESTRGAVRLGLVALVMIVLVVLFK